MLRAAVSLSREVTRDSRPLGYAVTLDGEIPYPPTDPEGVLFKVGELFQLAAEALEVEIDRDRPPPPPSASPATAVRGTTSTDPGTKPTPTGRPEGHGEHPTHPPESATPSQQRYIRTLARRKGLTDEAFGTVVASVAGAPTRLGELTKRDAGALIGHLTGLRTGGGA